MYIGRPSKQPQRSIPSPINNNSPRSFPRSSSSVPIPQHHHHQYIHDTHTGTQSPIIYSPLSSSPAFGGLSADSTWSIGTSPVWSFLPDELLSEQLSMDMARHEQDILKSLDLHEEEEEEEKPKKQTFPQQDQYLVKMASNSAHGRKTYRFRTAYLTNCQQYNLIPSTELIRSIKNSIRSQQPLQRLSICHAQIDDVHVRVLIDSLIKDVNNDVDEILLNHNNITDIGACDLFNRLMRRCDRITSLELFGNRIGDESCYAIAEMLSSNSNLKRLKLGDNMIGATGAHALAQGLRHNTSLTQLHLGGNRIQVQGLQSIAEALIDNATLTSLGLRDNDVGPDGMAMLAKTLRSSTCALSDIQLKGNQIRAQGAMHLAHALQMNRSLKVLELQSNQIGPAGARALCDALHYNSSVHALNFNENELGDEGAEAVCLLLQHNTSITTLGLANNRIRKRGASFLSKALEHPNSAVTGLDLGSNEIGNNGAVALSKALRQNKVMTSLDLRSCEIHLKGCLSLAEMAQHNTTLRHLDLGANYCKNQGALAWAQVLQNNSTLTRLCLTDNQIYHDGGVALAAALQNNYSLRNFSYGGQGSKSNKIESTIRRIIDSIVAENKKHWETSHVDHDEQIPSSGKEDELDVILPYSSNNQYRFVDVSKLRENYEEQQQPTSFESGYDSPRQLPQQQQLPSWFTASMNIPRTPIDPIQLDQRLEYLFKNNLLKAQNPKFAGCYFIGNVINTLKKVFSEYSKIDEFQLVQFAYNNSHKYYVHLSREMVKTQIKYLGDVNSNHRQEHDQRANTRIFSTSLDSGYRHHYYPQQFSPTASRSYGHFNFDNGVIGSPASTTSSSWGQYQF
jgi:Ran GTPase-activating protein (RanGAP) involved in mRNA processing and transport